MLLEGWKRDLLDNFQLFSIFGDVRRGEVQAEGVVFLWGRVVLLWSLVFLHRLRLGGGLLLLGLG